MLLITLTSICVDNNDISGKHVEITCINIFFVKLYDAPE